MSVDELSSDEKNRITGLEEEAYVYDSLPKKKRSYLKPFLAIVLVAGIAGGSYYAWQLRNKQILSDDKLSQQEPVTSSEVVDPKKKQSPPVAMLPKDEDLLKGVELFEKGLTGSAEAIFADLLESTVDASVKSQAAMFLGMISDDRGSLNQAVDFYQRAIKLNADNYYAYTNLAITLRKKGLFTKALEVLEKARQLNPDSSEASMLAGKLAYEENRLDESEKNLELAKEISPENALASYNLGVVHKKKGKTAEAKLAFLEALKLGEPGEIAAKAASQLGIMAATEQDFAAATTYLQKAVVLKPDNARYYYNLALIQAQVDLTEPAILNLNKALELGYQNPVLELYIARLYQDLEQPEKSYAVVKSAYDRAPGNLEVLRTLADMVIERKDYLEAMPLFEQLYAISTKSADRLHSLYNLAFIHFQLQDWVKSEQQLEKLLQLEPGHEQGVNLLGNVFRQKGENEKAISLYKQAIDLNPDDVTVRFTLARMYLDLGLLNETEAELKKILEVPAGTSEHKYKVFAMMGEIYRVRKAFATALSYFEKIENAPDLEIRFQSAINQAETMLAADMPPVLALKKIERAIALNPGSQNARLILASALMKKGTINARQRAEEELTALIRKSEDPYYLSQAHTLRGILNYKNGIFVRALDDFSMALEYDPTNEQAFKNKRAASLRLENG